MLPLVIALSVLSFACTHPNPNDGGPMDAQRDIAAQDGEIPGVTVEFGTGQSDYEDVPASGGQLELIYGAQGGYHVWGRARFRGFDPDVDVSFSATRVSDGRVLHTPQPARRWIVDGIRRGLNDEGGGSFATDAELVILSISCSDMVVGDQLTVRVFVRERSTGRVATDVRSARIVDAIPSPACGGGGG